MQEPKTQDTILILGGDGYLGWSLGLAFANRTNCKVVLADSLVKRSWEKEANAKLLIPLKTPVQKIAAYKKLYNKDNLYFKKVCLLDYDATAALIREYRPTVIINAAQQPSAPFSMMNPRNSAATYSNNIIGNLNVLWAIAEVDKNITYIKLGSAGCYQAIDTDFVPREKVDLHFKRHGTIYTVLKSWLPMYATDFYHQTKITDFLMDEMAAEVWGLKVLTVQQSTIFGATIPENRAPKYHALSARFNYDSVFGTVMNRFVCQLTIGHPLTIYGKGDQRTGIISLSDTVDNFIKFAQLKLSPGEHRVAHNYTLRYSINEIADALVAVAGEAHKQHLPNPRKETDGILRRQVEVEEVVHQSQIGRDRKLSEELADFVEFTRRYKSNIDPSIIMPTVAWDKHTRPGSHIKVHHIAGARVFAPSFEMTEAMPAESKSAVDNVAQPQ